MKRAIGCVGILALLSFLAGERAAGQPAAVVPVAVSPVVEREVLAGQSIVGSVEATRRSTVGSAVEERLETLQVNEGDRVAAGQVLATLRTETLQIALEAARLELEFRRQELAELENGSRPEEIAQGQSRVMAAQARRKLAEVQRQRVMNLRQTRAVSPEELDQSVASTEEATATLREAESALSLLVDGPRAEEVARARIRVKLQEQEIRRLEDQLEKHTIRAPYDGYITTEYVQVGQWVAKGEAIVDLVELDQVEISIPLLEDYVRFLEMGADARIEVDALPGRIFNGEVAHVVPQADLRSRSFRVQVRVPNERTGDSVLLKAGMFARVTLPVGEKKRALLVDKDAVVLGGPSAVVYVLVPEADPSKPSGVRPVGVELGVADEGLIEINGELKAGELVVVQGNERLRPGQLVQVSSQVEPGARRGGPEEAGR